MTPKAWSVKGRHDKLDLIRIKNCFSKDPLKSMKGKATEWETIFANHTSNKGPKSVTYKEFSKFNRQQQQQNQKYPIKNEQNI